LLSLRDDANVFVGFAPDPDRAEFDVRVVNGNAGLLGDLNFFKQRFECFIGLIADVRAVKAAVFSGGAGHSDDFGGVAVAADLVFEAAGEADRAFVHRLPRELRHLFDFWLAGDALEVLAHDLRTNGGVTSQPRDVDGGGIFLARLDPGGDGPRRFAVG